MLITHEPTAQLDRFETIELLLDHYQTPRHHGPLPQADVIHPGYTPGCGDSIVLHITLNERGTHIHQCSFEGTGCTISQATASLLTERVQGMPLAMVAALDVYTCFPELNPDVLRSRLKCATLALRTLQTAIAEMLLPTPAPR